MSDELAQEDEDAEDYDLEALESRNRARDDDDDDATLVDRRGGTSVVGEDAVVFEIGDQDISDDEAAGKTSKRHTSQHDDDDRRHGDDGERQGLMNGDSGHKDRDE